MVPLEPSDGGFTLEPSLVAICSVSTEATSPALPAASKVALGSYAPVLTASSSYMYFSAFKLSLSGDSGSSKVAFALGICIAPS